MNLLVLTLTTLFACSDSRQTAAVELVRFSSEAPFSIGAPSSRYSGYSVLVEDPALTRYNKLFATFDVPDSARSTAYKELASLLLWELPATTIGSARSKRLAGDTLLVTVPFQRPRVELYQERIREFSGYGDTASPTPEKRTGFREALRRARAELPEPDTAFVWVKPGPTILRWRTATMVRDSIKADSQRQVARVHLRQLVAEARFSALEASDYSANRSISRDLGGGAIVGSVVPGSTGWLAEGLQFGMTQVQCEAARGPSRTYATAYVSPEKYEVNSPQEFTCLWAGREGDEWISIRPNTFRVRLLATQGRDTIPGEWVRVR